MENTQYLSIMQTFIAVVESGGFSACARKLGVSQPTISRQINTLESQLGLSLLQRTTRRLSLTEAGELYYEKAKLIQREVADAHLAIADFKNKPSGVLRIAAPHTWAETFIGPHVGEFLSRYPGITLDIECNDQFQDMVEDRLDLVIRVGILKDSSYIAVPFSKIQVKLYATPAYLAQHGTPTTADGLGSHNFILFEDFNQFIITQNNQARMVKVSGNIKVNTVPLVVSALKQNMGITALPDLIVRPLVKSGEIVEVLADAECEIKNLPINQVFALYSSRKHLASKARVFLDFFREKMLGEKKCPGVE